MRATTIFLVDLPESARSCAQQAAEKALPEARLVRAATVKEALQHSRTNHRQILLLTDIDEMEVALAAQATDAGEMPRWATVVIGRTSVDVAESIPLEECTPERLARLFHSTLMQHELLRENIQLRGDLKTIARRLGHDLSSPLNCLHLNCELLDELLNGTDPSLGAQVGVIRGSLTEIAHLIQRYTDVVKASAEPMPAAEVAMGAVVNSVLDRLESVIKQKRATVQLPNNWPEAKGVSAWLEIVWWNLLANALAHSHASTPIQLGGDRNGNEVRFWVANSGAAVPVEIKEQLFPRFDRLHTQNRHGLGWSVVERLISLQGGRCGYERRRDDSSVFYFTLPVDTGHF